MKLNRFVRVLIAALLAAPFMAQAATFYTRLAGPTNWNTLNLWSTGGAVCSGGGVNGALPGAADTVTICAGHTVTMNVSPTILTINVIGTLSAGANTLTLGGTAGTLFTRTGTFNANTSTVVMNPNAAVTLTSGTVTFNNLSLTPTISAARTYTFGAGAVNVAGALNVNPTKATAGTAILTVNLGAALDVTGATTVTGTTNGRSLLDTTATNFAFSSGTLNVTANGTFTARGSTVTLDGTAGTLFTLAGTFNANTSTVVMNPDAAVTLTSGAITFNDLQLSPVLVGTNRTYTFGAGAITINGDFDINPTDSTVGSNRLTVNMGAAITVAPTGTTTIRGSGTAPGLATLSTGANFALTSGRLVVGTTATDGTFVANASTVTLNAASGTLFTRVGVFTQGTSTVILSPTAPVTLNSGTLTFNNLTTTMPGQTATLGNDITVSAVLNFGAANGYLVTGTNAVIIPQAGSISGAGAGGHVVGNLTRQFAASTTFLFTVGDGANYAPVNVVFTANVTGNLTLSASSPADHPNTVSGTSPADANRSVNRYWTAKGSTIAGTATLTFNYLAGSPRDLDTGVTASTFVIGRGGAGACTGAGSARLCTTWSRPTLVGPPTTTTAGTSGIAFTNAPAQESDFVVGEARRVSREREFIYSRETY